MSQFSLFVSGDNELTRRAVSNFEKVVRPAVGADCVLEVIDILVNPGRAVEQRILATPTLLRTHPPPPLRIVGDFSDQAAVDVLFPRAPLPQPAL